MMRKPLALSIMIALLTNSFPLMSIGNVFAEDVQATSTSIGINLSQDEAKRFSKEPNDIVYDKATDLRWSLEIKKDDTDSLEEAQKYCNDEVGPGRRVPSITEIRTLRRTRTNTQTQFHFDIFKNLSNNGVFYTSTKSLRRKGKVWFVTSQDLANKRKMWDEPNPITPKMVICVKGTRNTSLNRGDKGGKSNLTYSFVDGTTKGPTGIVQDEKTGLVWMSSGVRGEGTDTCSNSELGGGKYSWRIPSIAELNSLIDYSIDTTNALAINTNFFNVTGKATGKGEYPEYEDGPYLANDSGNWSWGVSFGDGFAGGIGKKRTLCVADISKDYVKVKLSPDTNGTLSGSTVFYVLKNKETNLTEPEIIPNKGFSFLGRFLDDQKLDLTNLPVGSSDITITAKFQPQDTTPPQVENQSFRLFEFDSTPIPNITLKASDQDNAGKHGTYNFVPANFGEITLDENGNIGGTSKGIDQINETITVKDAHKNENHAMLNISIVRPVGTSITNPFGDNITTEQIKQSIFDKNQFTDDYITNMSILDPIPTGGDKQQNVRVELTNIYRQKTTITTSVSYIYKKVKTLEQTVYSGDNIDAEKSLNKNEFEDGTSAENIVERVGWKELPLPTTDVANNFAQNQSGETTATGLVTYTDKTQKEQPVKIIWNPQSWRNNPQAKQNITKEINADIRDPSQFIEGIENPNDTLAYSRVGNSPATDTYGTKTGTIKITYSDGSRDKVDISFEVLSDTIPFDDKTKCNPNYYSTVTFATGDQGTFKDKPLGNEIKYCVRKDKKITLQAPDLKAKDGWYFSGRNPSFPKEGTLFDQGSYKYTAQYEPLPSGKIERDTNTWSKDKIILTLKTNKRVETPQGWNATDDTHTIFTGEINRNGGVRVTITDKRGKTNTQEIKVNVDRIDKKAPTINLTKNPDVDLTKESTIALDLTVSDDKDTDKYDASGIKSGSCKISIKNKDGEKTQNCDKKQISLAEGENSITVTAIDNAGNKSDKTVTVVSDRTDPSLKLKENVISLRRGRPAEIILTGTDNYKLGNIEIIGTLPEGLTAGKTIKNNDKEAVLSISGTPTSKGTYTLTGRITDAAGNKRELPFRIEVFSKHTGDTGGGGGGGSTSSTDYCPHGDHSGNLYDGKCDKTIITITTEDNNPVEKKPVLTGDLEKKPEPEKDSKPELIDGKTLYPDTVLFNPTIVNGQCYTRRPYLGIKDSTTIITDEEFKKAMSFLRSYEMTMFDSVDDYDPYRNLSREEAAKIFSNFAINVLCRKPDLNLKVNYSDVEDANPTLKPYITLAYQLGVMKGSGMGDGNFRPFDKITKAEVNAVLIRMILKAYLDESRSENKTWYDEYNKVATNLGIINQGAGAQPVSRNNVALMLFRAYKNQAFDWRNIDYFSYVLNSRDLFVK